MPIDIPSLSSVSLGVVPTHVKFVGGIVPDGDGKLPREAGGELVMVAEMTLNKLTACGVLSPR